LYRLEEVISYLVKDTTVCSSFRGNGVLFQRLCNSLMDEKASENRVFVLPL
jgi:hypothetical protein